MFRETHEFLKRVDDYCTDHSSSPPEYLQDLERETYLKTLAPQMIAGRLQGNFLYMITSLIKPVKSCGSISPLPSSWDIRTGILKKCGSRT